MAEAKRPVGELLGMSPGDFGLVTNATEGVNAVLRSLEFGPGDELLTTSHVYNAVRMAMRCTADRTGAAYVELPVPTPIESAGRVVDAIAGAITGRTRLVVIDHVSSPTAVVFPVREIAAVCAARGVELLVDGAHAPGMVDLDVPATGATYYAGNLHKWCCAPRGSGFLWVRGDRQERVHPCAVSHNYGKSLAEEFEWHGTRDASAWLSIPAALAFMGELGRARVRAHNHALALWARAMLCERWGVERMAPDEMLGSMATVRLPGALADISEAAGRECQSALYHRHGVEAPLVHWQGAWHVRVSAQVYNGVEDYERLDCAIRQMQ
ncbi:MAG TPA: aminotransferase class V-fold PLP-dependent enzyme [Tepidisphaeraceae bacterium]|nr:aminotransferase class V-fold PLP-dependent enzyme [Tepidisphaeraceae bacterium]